VCSIVDLKDGTEGERDIKDFQAYAQCEDTVDMKDGDGKGKETQSTFFPQAYMLAMHRCIWSERWE
jgi:hypothetical protein